MCGFTICAESILLQASCIHSLIMHSIKVHRFGKDVPFNLSFVNRILAEFLCTTTLFRWLRQKNANFDEKKKWLCDVQQVISCCRNRMCADARRVSMFSMCFHCFSISRQSIHSHSTFSMFKYFSEHLCGQYRHQGSDGGFWMFQITLPYLTSALRFRTETSRLPISCSLPCQMGWRI